jgi:DNA mismatch endonuclease, patch repair protein
MRGNRGEDTRPEVLLRSALHRRGLRFGKNRAPVPGIRCRPDIVFPAARLAVFVDGCFWHRCPDHGISPRTNSAYWTAKLDRNVSRDRRNDRDLRAAGWAVIRVWEHEDASAVADWIERAVDARSKAVLGRP